MKRKVKYAILKYIPNIERNEKINIAVVLHSPDQEEIEMTVINRWARVKKFDDEADINFLKKYVDDLKEKFTKNLFNNFDGMQLNDNMLLDEMTKYFVNKFVFEIHEINSNDNFNHLLEYLKKIYLHYDISIDKRITEKERKAFVERNLLEKNITYERMGTKNAIQEKYGNNVNFDYKINNIYYKLIFLTEDNYNAYVAMLKMWIANSMILAKENKKLIFVIDDLINNEKTENYKRMLSENATIISIQDFINMKIDANRN